MPKDAEPGLTGLSNREKAAKVRKLKSVMEVLDYYRQNAPPPVRDQLQQFESLSRMQRVELLAYLMTSINQMVYDLQRQVAQMQRQMEQFQEFVATQEYQAKEVRTRQ